MELDIVELIESNPITKLTGNYQSKLIEKVKNNFTNYEQQIFLSSFYCYLNYDYKNDFIVDLDNVWKWLGFSNKAHAKYNFALVEELFGTKIPLTTPASLRGHIADSFMQVLGYLIYGPDEKDISFCF